jgi:integrase
MARKRGNGEGSIYRRANGTWAAQYTVWTAEGRKRRSVFGDGRGWVLGGSTKSGKGRRVRLTQRAVAALKDHRKRQLEERMRLVGLWQDHGLVFPNEIGSLLNPSNLRNRSF